jgi:UDP-N-acetylmuramyl pentapeptide synthase
MDAELQRLIAACSAYTSDSRDARAGDLFVALRGNRHDGHAFEPGRSGLGVACVVQRGTTARLQERSAFSGRLVEVDDTHRAHRAIAGPFIGASPGR